MIEANLRLSLVYIIGFEFQFYLYCFKVGNLEYFKNLPNLKYQTIGSTSRVGILRNKHAKNHVNAFCNKFGSTSIHVFNLRTRHESESSCTYQQCRIVYIT